MQIPGLICLAKILHLRFGISISMHVHTPAERQAKWAPKEYASNSSRQKHYVYGDLLQMILYEKVRTAICIVESAQLIALLRSNMHGGRWSSTRPQDICQHLASTMSGKPKVVVLPPPRRCSSWAILDRHQDAFQALCPGQQTAVRPKNELKPNPTSPNTGFYRKHVFYVTLALLPSCRPV